MKTSINSRLISHIFRTRRYWGWLLFFVTCRAVGQSPVQSLHPHVTIDTYATLSRPGVRIAHDPVTKNLLYADVDGTVFRLQAAGNEPPVEVPVATVSDHGISLLQGMVIADSLLILVGVRSEASQNRGRIMKGRLRPDGTRQWTVLLETGLYPTSGTAYDHSFNGVCLSRNRDSIYVNSGSRTDHGEVQNNGGQFPGLREVPLTARVFRFPLAGENLVLANDEQAVQQSGFLFCNGTRNTFDMAFNSEGQFFGAENAGNRSDPEELNWLRPGRHYGFPWLIGGNETPQQFPDYNPDTDPLLSPAYRGTLFNNDPTYPARPNRPFTPGVVNLGPAARQVIDPATGQLVDTPTLNTFTSHASPLGLVFDTDSVLADFAGQGFVLGYTPSRGLDLSALQLQYDPVIDNYRMTVTRIAENFWLPTDAELVDTTLYVLERGRNTVYRVRFRKRTYPAADLSISMTVNRRTITSGDLITTTILVRNEGPETARSVRISNRLPDGLAFSSSPDFALTPVGLVARLPALPAQTEQTLTYLARVMRSGTYLNAAQVSWASCTDPDSRPNTGTRDGEDDATTVDFRTVSDGSTLRQSPNPIAALLPLAKLNQPTPNPNYPDLRLATHLETRLCRLNSPITVLFRVANDGGLPANTVRIRCRLSATITAQPGAGWTISGQEALSDPFLVSSAAIVLKTLQIKSIAVGTFTIQATLIGPADADSIPDNGFTNGEDDEALADGRTEF